MITVIGLDLSLSATGISTGRTTAVIRPKKVTGVDRLRWINDQIGGYIVNACNNGQTVPTVAVEGPSYGSVGPGQHERGGLWWHIVEVLDRAGFPVVVVPPTVLKRFATGKGTAGKDEVILAAARRFEWFTGGNDEADSLFLACVAAELLGEPIVDMPLAHRRNLASTVQWVRTPATA